MGPQFAHIQTFSRKANPAGQSVDQVLGELTRDPEFSKHVENPEPVMILDGISPQQLRAEHDAMIERAATEVRIKGEIKMRAIRKDRHTLITAVVSYPLTWEEIGNDPKEQAALKEWQDANVAFFKDHFGEHYRAAYGHTDEARPHLHIYGLPEGIKGIDAALLHPGKAAKKAEEDQRKAEGDAPRAVVAAGNKVFRATMREWQDTYHQQVGEPCGLLRVGPKRQRLSRAQYQLEKNLARQRSKSELEAQRLKLLEIARAGLAEAEVVREDRIQLQADWEELEAQRRKHKRHEEELHAVINMIQQATERMRKVVQAVTAFFGLGMAKNINESLTAIEAAVQNAQKVHEKRGSEPDDGMVPM